MSAALVHVVEALEFSGEQRQMIRDTFANGASEQEFSMLLEVARARRLSPILKQIHFVKRWDTSKRREVWAAQASIDGLRAIAERTGKYDGQDEPEYVEKDGRILCCKVRVYRKDWSRPVTGVAYYDEYVQTTKEGKVTSFWARMPHVMLAKCAEAIAMRKAFPEDMSGLYTAEEMGSDAAPVGPVAVDAGALPRLAPAAPPSSGKSLEAVLEASLETPSWPAWLEARKAEIVAAQSTEALLSIWTAVYQQARQLEVPSDVFAALSSAKDARKATLRGEVVE